MFLNSSAQPVQCGAGEFWPSQPSYVVSHLSLQATHRLPRRLQQVTPAFRELMNLANAARDLEEHPVDTRTIEALDQRAAELLLQIADHVHVNCERSAIVERARLLRSGRWQPTADDCHALYGHRDEEIFILYGRLKTWCQKGGAPLHSGLVAAPCAWLNSAVDELDASGPLDVVRRELEDDRLVLGELPKFSVTDLIMCAGEANRHPKHFSYFLPEDECPPAELLQTVTGGPGCKTIVFSNLYVHRYATSSYPRLERFYAGMDNTGLSPTVIAQCLTLWMRGHDIGHAVRYCDTNLKLNRHTVGIFPMMCLEEALADCLGLLILVGCRVRALQPLTLRECIMPFLGEMLRYVGRGQGVFQDSDAALLELSFLMEREAVTWNGNRLTVHPERLLVGVKELAQLLTRGILRHDAALLRTIHDRYLTPRGSASAGARALQSLLFAGCRDLPTSTTYTTHY